MLLQESKGEHRPFLNVTHSCFTCKARAGKKVPENIAWNKDVPIEGKGNLRIWIFLNEEGLQIFCEILPQKSKF